MLNRIDHDKLVEHARRLDSEARQWTERELRSTYSREHLFRQAQTGEPANPAERKPTATESQSPS